MAEPTKHGIGSPAMVDQEWATAINNIAVDRLGWNMSTISPKVDYLYFPKAFGFGVKINDGDPQWAWNDLLGEIKIDREAASNKPTFAIFRDTLKAYQFLVNDQVYVNYHLPHDYAKGTDVFIHVHWSHSNASAVTGDATWAFEISYSKGHGQGTFHASKTISATQSAGAQYQHNIAEVQVSLPGGDSSHIDTDLLEPDGIFLVRVYLSANTLSPATNPFLHYADMHYQSTGIGTKQKAPDFYA